MVLTGRAKGAWRYVAALGVVACAAAALAAEDGPKPPPPSQSQAAQSQSAPDAAAAPVKPPTSIAKSDKEAGAKDSRAPEKTAIETGDSIKWTDKIVAGSALASAFFALVLAFFTWRLIVVGRDQHKAAMDALKLASDEFNAVHRPRIVLRELTLIRPGSGEPAKVCFRIVNAGDGDAILGASSFAFGNLTADGEAVDGEPQRTDVGGHVLKIGATHSCLEDSKLTDTWFTGAVATARWRRQNEYTVDNGIRIIFSGEITYFDGNQLPRKSAFYREYDFAKMRFGPGDDPEREYAD